MSSLAVYILGFASGLVVSPKLININKYQDDGVSVLEITFIGILIYREAW